MAALLVSAGLGLTAQGAWIPAKAALAQILLERAFAETLATGHPTKPWPWADTVPVARLTVGGENYIALAGSSGAALAFGPGHIEGTPQAGDPGTAVYAAHRDTHFAVLGRLKPGDRITVTRLDGRTAVFRVTASRVGAWDSPGIDPDGSEPKLVLSTCWPLDGVIHGPLRLIVEAEGVDGV